MKIAISAALALCATALDVNPNDFKTTPVAEQEPLPHRIIKSVVEHEFFSAPRQEQINSLYNVGPCQYWYNDAWYNLIGTGGFSPLAIFEAPHNLATPFLGVGNPVAFGMCKTLAQCDDTVCTGTSIAGKPGNFYAGELSSDPTTDTTCTPLATNSLSSITDFEFTLPNGDKTLGLNYQAGPTDDGTTPCQLQVGLKCNENMHGTYTTTALTQLPNWDATSQCQFSTVMESELACPVYSLNALWAWLNEFKWLWGICLLVMGFFLCLFGQKLFSATLLLIGTLVTVAAIWLLFYTTFLTDKTAEWIGWTVLACSIVLGLFGGYLLYKCQRLGAAVVGGFGGFMCGVLFDTTVLWSIESNSAFWICSVVGAIIGALGAFIFYYHAVILSTSFVGGYMFIRGISLYAGGYPNEWALIEQIKSGALDHIPYWFYLYLVGIILCTVIGAIFQYKHFKKGVENGDYDANGHPKHPYAS